MSEKIKSSSGGIGCLTAMFLIMFALKLAGVADISWWIVVSPLFMLVFAVAILAAILEVKK